jgi:hypothetical protein
MKTRQVQDINEPQLQEQVLCFMQPALVGFLAGMVPRDEEPVIEQ